MVIVSVLRDRGLRDKRELFYSPFVILFLSSAYQDARKCVVIKVLMLNSHAWEQCGCSSAFDLASICPLRSSTALVGCFHVFLRTFETDSKKWQQTRQSSIVLLFFSLFFVVIISSKKRVFKKAPAYFKRRFYRSCWFLYGEPPQNMNLSSQYFSIKSHFGYQKV